MDKEDSSKHLKFERKDICKLKNIYYYSCDLKLAESN